MRAMAALSNQPLAWAFGSYPAALALERGPRFGLAAAVAAAPLSMVPMPLRAVGLVAAAYVALWLAVALGHALRFASCRQRSREGGLRVLVVVAESPWLAARLHRRRAIPLPRRPFACSVHVDPTWRPPGGLAPTEAAKEFGRQYRLDYDILLGGLRGLPVLVGSSTFNRHESAWTSAAVAAGWGWQRAGPLFSGAPPRHHASARARQQRLMLGGVVSGRPAHRWHSWRTRVFDCQAAHAVC